MTAEPADELLDLAVSLRSLQQRGEEPSVREPLERLEDAAIQVGKAWSGSPLGYQAYVYYADLQPPPPGAHFSIEWGLMGVTQGSTGDWREYDYDDVRNEILSRAGNPDLSAARELALEASRGVSTARSTMESIFAAAGSGESDGFLDNLARRLADVTVLTTTEATEAQIRSGNIMTRDQTAAGQGARAAPHQELIGLAFGIRSPISACGEIADLAEQAAGHMQRLQRRKHREVVRESGTFVFVGHGRSGLWRELKDFIQERLGLPCDEFNRVPVAGVTNVERLVQMLDDAAIAFLVLTAEDERIDGAVAARQNVVHEAGLFQGRLGFTRAIVLLEDGCEEFSNIAGLGQIRFPAGNISAAFEEIRAVAERENLI